MERKMYVVQGFDMNKRIIDARVCKTREEAERVAERMSKKGAFWINISESIMGAY